MKVKRLTKMSTGEFIQHQNKFLKKYSIDFSYLKNLIKTSQTEKYKAILRKKKIAILTSPVKTKKKKKKRMEFHVNKPGG